jgi:hypothetical protein
MASSFARQGQGVEIRSVRYPACECGQPYTAHAPAGCQGYRPSRPVEDLGTRAYTQPLGRSTWRWLVCGSLWAIERRAQAARRRLGGGM